MEVLAPDLNLVQPRLVQVHGSESVDGRILCLHKSSIFCLAWIFCIDFNFGKRYIKVLLTSTTGILGAQFHIWCGSVPQAPLCSPGQDLDTEAQGRLPP